MLPRVVYVLAILSVMPAILFGIDTATSSGGSIGRGIGWALTTASAGAFLITSLPALALVDGRPWPALGIVLLYPIAWIGIMITL